jgi:hypothetical protein
MSLLGVDLVEEEDIAELAATFWRIPRSDLGSLPPEILNSILRHPKLMLESEDCLFELLAQHVEAGDAGYFDLLALVQVEFLSRECVQHYFELVSSNFEQFNLTHWESLRWRILGDSNSRPSADRRWRRREFPPNSETRGVFWHLTAACGGNVAEKQEVLVTASSVHASPGANGGTARWEMKYAVDHNIETHFHADNNANEWICFDFNKRIMTPSHYEICSGWHPLKSWRVEGSLDGNNWFTLDEQKDNLDISKDKMSHTFPVMESRAVRMIRLTQTGRTHNGEKWFMIRRFEVFGTLLEPPTT